MHWEAAYRIAGQQDLSDAPQYSSLHQGRTCDQVGQDEGCRPAAARIAVHQHACAMSSALHARMSVSWARAAGELHAPAGAVPGASMHVCRLAGRLSSTQAGSAAAAHGR